MNENSRYSPRGKDVNFILDAYDLYQQGARNINEVRISARALTGIVSSHGVNNHYSVVLHKDDIDRNDIFKELGYSILTMNGQRPQELQDFISSTAQSIHQSHPRKIIVVSKHPEYSRLFSMAVDERIDLGVWVPGNIIPDEYLPYMPRFLNELLPAYSTANKVLVRLDAENHLIGLFRLGFIPQPKAYIRAIRDLVSDLGDIVNIHASADWDQLRRMLQRDYQREFEQIGVRTIYQINVPHKNTSDIALAGNIQEALERNPQIDTFVVGSGDSDFLPLVTAIHEQGKKVVIVSIQGTLSKTLAATADHIRYLDDFFLKSKGDTPVDVKSSQKQDIKDKVYPVHSFITTMKIANLLDVRNWKYCYYNRLPQNITIDELTGAIDNGYLKNCQVEGNIAVTLNLNSPVTRQIKYFTQWIKKILPYSLSKFNTEYCDTARLQAEMSEDSGCRKMSIGQSIADAQSWLNTATSAGVIERELRFNSQQGGSIVQTWWPIQENENQLSDRNSLRTIRPKIHRSKKISPVYSSTGC